MIRCRGGGGCEWWEWREILGGRKLEGHPGILQALEGAYGMEI